MKKIIRIGSGLVIQAGEGIRNRYVVEEKERIFSHLWLGEVSLLEVIVRTVMGARIVSSVCNGSKEFCYDCLRKDPNLPSALRDALNEYYSRIRNRKNAEY